jgi:hypothetical protein
MQVYGSEPVVTAPHALLQSTMQVCGSELEALFLVSYQSENNKKKQTPCPTTPTSERQ